MRLIEKVLNSKSVERFRRFLGTRSGIYLKLKRLTPSSSEEMRNAAILNHLGIKYVLDVGANTGQFAESLFDFGCRPSLPQIQKVRCGHLQQYIEYLGSFL